MQLRLDRVGRIFQWDWAVRDVSATWNDSQIVCILGANGSGKSTLLRLISGMLRPTSGSVEMDGRRVRRGATSLTKRMLLLTPDLRPLGGGIAQHLGTALAAYGCDDVRVEKTAADWVQRLDLASHAHQHPVTLSRGQAMKLWLATLFTLRPELWLLDEPHQSGLDARGIEILEAELTAHRDRGGTVIFTSQYPPHARSLADRVLLLDQNECVFEGPIDSLHGDAFGDRPSIAAIVRGLEPREDHVDGDAP